MDKDILLTSLSASRQILFQSVLEDQYPRLGLDGSSTVFASTIDLAETLTKWLQTQSHDMPRSIILTESVAQAGRNIDTPLQKAANLIPVAKVQDETVTHAFSHIASYKRDQALNTFKDIFYALIPKGIAVVTCTKRNPVEEIVLQTLRSTGRRGSTGGLYESASEDDLRNLAEQAQFELGKIRVDRKDVVVQGEDLVLLKGSVEKTLDGMLGQTGDGHSWERTFDQVWDAEVQKGGGQLVIEWFVLVAMKVDDVVRQDSFHGQAVNILMQDP